MKLGTQGVEWVQDLANEKLNPNINGRMANMIESMEQKVSDWDTEGYISEAQYGFLVVISDACGVTAPSWDELG